MKTIVAGSRTFDDWDLMQRELMQLKITEVISGHASGADKMGEWYAMVNKIPCVIYPAGWKMYGRCAGIIRNIEMAKYGEQLVAFWDGKSPGTKHMIAYFTDMFPDKPCKVIRYK